MTRVSQSQGVRDGRVTEADVELFIHAANLVKQNVVNIYDLPELHHHMTYLTTRRAEASRCLASHRLNGSGADA